MAGTDRKMAGTDRKMAGTDRKMAGTDRKRNISTSSESEEDDARKSARKEEVSGSDLTGATDSDSSDSSSSSSGSSSDSSDSSGSDEEMEKKRVKSRPKTSKHPATPLQPVVAGEKNPATPLQPVVVGEGPSSVGPVTCNPVLIPVQQPSTQVQQSPHPHTQVQQPPQPPTQVLQPPQLLTPASETTNLTNISATERMGDSILKSNDNSHSVNPQGDVLDNRNTDQAVSERDLYLGGATPGNFCQEELLQFLEGDGEGFVDPVFVDHEDSQNAADLDQLVFENQKEDDEDAHFLNDPRLGSICSNSNSLGNSDKGSINLNEMEDGELPSSPEPEPHSQPISQPLPAEKTQEPVPTLPRETKYSSLVKLSSSSQSSSYISKSPHHHQHREISDQKSDRAVSGPQRSDLAESAPQRSDCAVVDPQRSDHGVSDPQGSDHAVSDPQSSSRPMSKTSQIPPREKSELESDFEIEKSRKRKKLKKRRDLKSSGKEETEDEDEEVHRSRSKKKRKEKSPSPKKDKSKPCANPRPGQPDQKERPKVESKYHKSISPATVVPDNSDKHSQIQKPAHCRTSGEKDKKHHDKSSRGATKSTDKSSICSSTVSKSSNPAKPVPPPPLPPPVHAPPPPSSAKSPRSSTPCHSKSPSRALSAQVKTPSSTLQPLSVKTLPSTSKPSPSKPNAPSSDTERPTATAPAESEFTPSEESKTASTGTLGTSLDMSMSSNDEGSVGKDSLPMDPPESEDSKDESGNKRKKLSLKDYKLKREAEQARRSIDGESGSEPPSQTASTATSKEPSPEPTRGETVTRSSSSNTQNAEHEFLSGFDILDEVENESDTDSKSVYSSGDSMDEEVYALLERDVKRPQGAEPIVPEETVKKLVLEERGGTEFDVLPLGWVVLNHHSGMPLYLHKESRVVTCSRPYDLGMASFRNHNIPISSIPCYSYRFYSNLGERQPSSPSSSENPKPSSSVSSLENPKPSSSIGSADNPNAVSSADLGPKEQKKSYVKCPFSGVYGRENVSPDSTTIDSNSSNRDDTAMEVETTVAHTDKGGTTTDTAPKPQVECIGEKKRDLTPQEVHEYCSKVFTFKEVEVSKFRSWKDRRNFMKQEHRRRAEQARPQLPEGTKVITIPTVELVKVDGAEGDSALNQLVAKKSKKQWVLNPNGKSMVCLLHEYVQQSLRSIPKYEFAELDNAATPYSATVHINMIQYGRGVGPSKKIAKSRAARQALEMMIPSIKDKLPDPETERGEDGPDLKFFNDIRVEDPRVAELCNRASEPGPYYILLTCLQRNYGLGDNSVTQELKPARNGKMEFCMLVNKRQVSVICKNKKDGKQLAAQKMLQQLHPNIGSWGSLLRMYGNRSSRIQKQKKIKESEVLALQSKSSNSTTGSHSVAILKKLKTEMRNLKEMRDAIVPIGKFQPPPGVPTSGLETDHLDI